MANISARPQIPEQAGCVVTRPEGVRIHRRLTGEDVVQSFARLPKGTEGVRRSRSPHHVPRRRRPVGHPRQALRPRRDREASVPDVRPVEERLAGHVPGALSAPADQVADRSGELPEAPEAVVSRGGEYRDHAYAAARLLADGVCSTFRFDDGMLERRPAEDVPSSAGATT